MSFDETQIRLFGLAMIFYALATFGFIVFFNSVTQEAKGSIKTSNISLELIKKDVQEKLKDKVEARNELKIFLIWDSFAFVPLYFTFLIVMSFFLSRTSFKWAKTAAALVVFATIILAIADWTENFYSYKLLDTVFSAAEESVRILSWAAHIKWILLFAVTGTLAAIFWRGGWWNIAAILLLSSSLTALIGLKFCRDLITLSLTVQLFTILVVGIAFMFSTSRQSFLQNH